VGMIFDPSVLGFAPPARVGRRPNGSFGSLSTDPSNQRHVGFAPDSDQITVVTRHVVRCHSQSSLADLG
jgi:hypothetical protein